MRRTARRRTCCRLAGLLAVLVAGASATAVGVSTDPIHRPEAAGASETRDLRGIELATARRSVSDRPVEGVLLTHAATLTDQARVAAAAVAAQNAARLAAAQSAAGRSTATPATAGQTAYAPHTGVNWDAIARCETGGNWSMSGGSYSGGLGFANSTWSGFGGGQFAANAGQASREQQIVVAERVYARYGLSGWGCRRFG